MPITIDSAFNVLLQRQQLTVLQVNAAHTRVSAIQTFFDNNFDMAERVFKAGSFARGTICAGQKDIDLLAPLTYSTYKDTYDNNSSAFLYLVRNRLNARYHATQVSSRKVAVTLNFNTITVDLVPCFKRGDAGGGYYIPDGSGGWTATNPKYHMQVIANSDRVHGGRLKPLIRLIKAWNLANGNHLQSFHIEVLVYKMWQGINMHSTLAANVKATLNVLASWVNNPCYDPWSPTTRIDNYLSHTTRAMLVRMLNIDSDMANDAERLRTSLHIRSAFDKWNRIYRNTFPAYGHFV